MRLFVLLIVAFSTSLVASQEPLIVEATQQRDTPFRIEHPEGAKVKAIFATVDASGSIKWSYLPDVHFIREASVTYMAAPPGEYLITAGSSQIIRVIEEGKPNPRPQPPPPDPQPNPGPAPGPQPNPQPDPEKIKIDWAVWVEESADRFQYEQESQTMYSADLWQYMADKGIKRFVYDDDQDGADPWVKFADGKLPSLVLFQIQPQKVLSFPAPKTIEEAKSLIEEHGQ